MLKTILIADDHANVRALLKDYRLARKAQELSPWDMKASPA